MLFTVAAAVLATLPAVLGQTPAAAATGYPTTPRAEICGNAAVLNGPAVQPAGSVRVDPGQDLNALTQARPAGTTFWLAPGTHRLGTEPLSQVIPRDNNAYIGAPGAVLDGGGVNRYAFTQHASGVVIRHLTIQNFGPVGSNNNEGVVNHDSGSGWVVEFNTIRNNAGAGLMVGDDNVVRSNCLADNRQYGLSTFKAAGITNITVDRNEIKGNNTDDWESRIQWCGCSGAMKFWDVHGAAITDNWVHHNKGAGIWADTNNYGFRIEGNYINDNDAEGIFYEISYNARIVNNTLKRNTLVKGKEFASRGENFPIGSIYISESGGDARIYGGVYSTLEIAHNLLDDNWGGVVLWENSDRFCGSAANTSGSYCTLGGAASLSTCVPGTINSAPYLSDCRWKTQNVSVHDNEFRFDKAAIGCTSRCGFQAVLANWGTFPDWSPYKARVIQDAITYHQNNTFSNNTYVGDWNFLPYETANTQPFSSWQSTFGQDAGSTLVLSPGATTTTTAPPTTTTTVVPPATGNALDPATSNLESSVGAWVPWFSAATAATAQDAHTGSRSLKIDVTAPHGWGVTQHNFPGFAETPGDKTVRFAAKAAAGSGLGVTMWVHWRNSSGADIKTDSVSIPSLDGNWRQASAPLSAPAGTAKVAVDFSNSTGVAGNALYVDDVLVTEAGAATPAGADPPVVTPPPSSNHLDADTSGLEGSAGAWVPWFSANVGATTEQAHSGTRSLKVAVTAPHGWGVTQNNHPGFSATPGPTTFGFWGRAGAGAGVSATMWVHWRNGAGANLRTDSVTLPLGSAWARAGADVTAPAGTERVAVDFTNSSGVAGDTLYLDDVTVGAPATAEPAATAPNALDADTAGLEGTVGKWVPWFSATATRSGEQAHAGAYSLKVGVTAPHGWGVTQHNFPGFTATAGPRKVSFWGRAGSGSGIAVTMWVHWRNASGADIRTDSVVLPALGTTWAQATADVTAPAGTTSVGVDFTNSAGVAGNFFYLDDIAVSG